MKPSQLFRRSILFFFVSLPLTSFAQFDESGFRQALKVKKDAYVGEGSISGGDRNSADFRVSQIRIAPDAKKGYDRVVVELSGNSGGEKSNLARPPFFLVELDGANHRVNVTVYGKPKLDFSTQMAIQAAKKTKTISKLKFIPLVNPDRWTWSIETQTPVKAEVFELTDPARMIIDLKR